MRRFLGHGAALEITCWVKYFTVFHLWYYRSFSDHTNGACSTQKGQWTRIHCVFRKKTLRVHDSFSAEGRLWATPTTLKHPQGSTLTNVLSGHGHPDRGGGRFSCQGPIRRTRDPLSMFQCRDSIEN